MGVVGQMEEGEIGNSATVESGSTELPLIGIAGADIVMTGGGSEADAAPFKFELQNLVHG